MMRQGGDRQRCDLRTPSVLGRPPPPAQARIQRARQGGRRPGNTAHSPHGYVGLGRALNPLNLGFFVSKGL